MGFLRGRLLVKVELILGLLMMKTEALSPDKTAESSGKTLAPDPDL